MSEAEQKKNALRIINEILKTERPIILHDKHDSKDHILFLKGLSAATLDKNPDDIQNTGDASARYLATVKPILPFLYAHGAMSEEFEMHSIELEGRVVTGLSVPAGAAAFDALEKTYKECGEENPFTLMTTGSDKGMIETILNHQNIDGGRQI